MKSTYFDLSIIIPAYNASSYIQRCIFSIENEIKRSHISANDIEIIIVDDCSTDNTVEITERVKGSLELSSLRIVRHLENRQQGAARNTGLKMAQGRYVWFVDADDSVGVGILQYLKSNALARLPDVLQFHAATEDLEGNVTVESCWETEIGPMSGPNFLEFEAKYSYGNRIRASWSKWFKREYLLENFLFYEEGVYWEDVVHTLKTIYTAQSIIYLPVIGYTYILTPNSDMRGALNGRKLADSIRFCVDSIEYLIAHNASLIIIDSMLPYYQKVLRKCKSNLGELSLRELNVFREIVIDFNLRIISQHFGDNEHDWLMDNSMIESLHNAQTK